MKVLTDPASPQVTKYLDELARELAGVPRKYRVEVVESIRMHIQDALEDPDAEPEAVLDRLGTAKEVAEQAVGEFVQEPSRIAHSLDLSNARRFQIAAFILALLVVIFGTFSLQTTLAIPVRASSIPPLVLTLIPLFTRGRARVLTSAVCAATLALFLLTSTILVLTIESFSFPLTIFLIPILTMLVFYLPAFTLAVIPLLRRRGRAS